MLQVNSRGSLSEQLLKYFEAHGDFYVDEATGAPWLSLSLANGERAATGLSRSHVMEGDPGLAALVLASVVDYNLQQSAAQRDDIEYLEWALTMLRQVSETVGRQAAGR